MEMTATSMAHDSVDATEKNGVRADAAALSAPLRPPAAAATLPDLLRRIWAHLSSKRRWQLGLLLAVMIVSGLAEAMSLAAVVIGGVRSHDTYRPRLPTNADCDRAIAVSTAWLHENPTAQTILASAIAAPPSDILRFDVTHSAPPQRS